jgi:hypothetical protein
MSTVSFLFSHTPQAVLMAGLFGLGGAAAWVALRWRVEFLLAAPRAFAGLLRSVMDRRPPWPALALFIFGFNGAAMLAYMLTGVLPWGAHAVAFLTGLNVVAAGFLAREAAPAWPPPVVAPLAQLCGALTFLLELPCFWYAMAMGATIEPDIVGMIAAGSAAPLWPRIQAYVLIILPALAVSAMAEAYAVSRAQPQQ